MSAKGRFEVRAHTSRIDERRGWYVVWTRTDGVSIETPVGSGYVERDTAKLLADALNETIEQASRLNRLNLEEERRS